MNRVTLSVDIPHNYHLISHHRSLYPLHLLYLVILTVFRCQDFHLQYHLIWNLRILSHIHLLLQVYTSFKSPQFWHKYSLLITHNWNFSKFQLLLPFLIPVPFTFQTPKFYFCILIHVYYLALHHQDLVLWPLMLQNLQPQGCHQWHPKESYLNTTDLLLPQPQVWFCLRLQMWYTKIHHHICLVYYQP